MNKDRGGGHKAQRIRCCESLNTLFAFEQTLTSFASYISLVSADIFVVLACWKKYLDYTSYSTHSPNNSRDHHVTS